jgi:hypothetical protein
MLEIDAPNQLTVQVERSSPCVGEPQRRKISRRATKRMCRLSGKPLAAFSTRKSVA